MDRHCRRVVCLVRSAQLGVDDVDASWTFSSRSFRLLG